MNTSQISFKKLINQFPLNFATLKGLLKLNPLPIFSLFIGELFLLWIFSIILFNIFYIITKNPLKVLSITVPKLLFYLFIDLLCIKNKTRLHTIGLKEKVGK